ncbi:indoleamine 2,3-dioxygenase 1 isoform X3 [Phyllopteryx taeniolatus]|uniref:indoleamine 2,3-dioxygenase 1 isoform X3 n=1 Tax=Phyllopteryx taeniolatus TaxID=161469 RepID=UPI002AD23035|nr:indoleamine 2,3-dioxygenase 1 isoform X3 [Phyllopteryx taeniolatus]
MAAYIDSTAPFSLDVYHVSEELGFILPEPLHELPPYYQPWMDIAQRVPELVLAHELRAHINKMPLLSIKFLQRHRELRLAHLALGVMTMGYVWQEGETNTVEMLPHTLAVPYWELSQRLGLPPILTHADAVLANWRKKDPEGPLDIENLELVVSIPGGESVRGFFIVTLMVERAAIPALRSIPKVINGVRCGDTKAVAKALEDISQSIDGMAESLRLMQGAFLTCMRNYMLPGHKQLIGDISLQPSLRTFVQQQESEQLTVAFQECVTKLLALRSYHITVVTHFITIPAAKARQLRKQSRDEEAGMISKAPATLEERGTGGTGIMSFLKTVRNQTRDTLLPKTSKEMKHKS